MTGIRKWIRGKMGSMPKAKEEDERPMLREPLLFLPATCPRLLIPEAAQNDQTPGFSSSLQNYGLFSRVPYEVRRQILVEAFGGRRLHMNLSYGHPLSRKAQNTRTSESGPSSVTTHRHCNLGSELAPDDSQPKGWQWFGCVCHRRARFSELEKQQRYDAGEYSQSIEPCDDDCLERTGLFCSCQVDNSDDPGAACFVGAMGWILACRQA